jgi:murein DD-endopeptidase MepM/ murein hydrolase activator NlpD
MSQTKYHNRDVKDLGIKRNKRSGSLRKALLRPVYWSVPVLAMAAIYVVSDKSGGSYAEKQKPAVNIAKLQIADRGTDQVVENASLLPQQENPATADTAIESPAEHIPAEIASTYYSDSTQGKAYKELLQSSPESWKSVKVKNGDTLYLILKRLGLNTADATFIAHSDNSKQLVRLIPSRTLHIQSLDGKNPDQLVYQDSRLTWVHAEKQGDSYKISNYRLPVTKHLRNANGEIESSLFLAGRDAGLNDTLIMEMAEIFGWDIDFAINVQPGDRFKLIFEDLYVDGQKAGQGKILAAEFINDGKTYRAIAHTDEDGDTHYYSPAGRSMQKTFLRTPVKFSRISSRFTRSRYHPVLKRKRAHRGVDYAAPTGTPVRSTAKGRVIHVGRKGGYGNAVIISHGSTYSTLYAHLSSYARGLKKGSKVKQGQIIGRVGSTGLASGPHLHYEFRINGKHVNPLTFKQPKSEPIQVAQKAKFEELANYWEDQLDSIDGLSVATQENATGS